MRVLVLHGSMRKNGNTEILAEEFIKGAEKAGCITEKIELRDKKINDCFGCGVCQQNGGKCVQKDDMEEIYEKFMKADVIVFASPVYFYTWTSLMKRVIDRTFAIESKVDGKKFFLISAGAATEEKYMQVMINSYREYIGCFRSGKNTDGGYVIGYACNMPTDAKESEAAKKAYELGEKIKE